MGKLRLDCAPLPVLLSMLALVAFGLAERASCFEEDFSALQTLYREPLASSQLQLQQQQQQQSTLADDDNQDDDLLERQAAEFGLQRARQQVRPLGGQPKWRQQQRQQHLADQIRAALRRYIGPTSAQDQARIQTRSSSSDSSIISKWLASTLADSEQLDTAEQAASSKASSAPSQLQEASSGHKSIRNVQPVLMRLPPRFGKRSC